MNDTTPDAPIDARYVPTGELANAFVAAHDTSLISSNPEAWGRERAINNLKAIDAGVEAVRARLTVALTPNPETVREAIRPAIRAYFEAHWYGTADGNPAVQHIIDEQTDDMVNIVMSALEDKS